jgi:hypothetical protein
MNQGSRCKINFKCCCEGMLPMLTQARISKRNLSYCISENLKAENFKATNVQILRLVGQWAIVQFRNKIHKPID